MSEGSQLTGVSDNESVKIFWSENAPLLPIPYLPAERPEKGNANDGYFDLKKNPELIPSIRELKNSRQLLAFVQTLNDPASFFRTLGCEKAFSESDSSKFERKLASYVDIVFEIVDFNGKDNFRRLFDSFESSARQYPQSDAIGVEFSIGPVSFNDLGVGGEYLALWNYGYGHSDSQAVTRWAMGLDLVRKFFDKESRSPGNQNELRKSRRTVS
jgi:hypothetical protein